MTGPASPRWPLVATLVLLVATTFVGFRWGTRAAGGSDSYGYVSQAYLWLDGGPPLVEPLARLLHVRDAAWVCAPLGYRPGRQLGEFVPIYPPGLPFLMAAAIRLAGPDGPFAVSPLAGAIAIWCTFLLGRRVSGPRTGALAAGLVATNPTFLYQLVQPMSDVPVTALWTTTLVLVAVPRTIAWGAAGVVAGLAVLVRPNLAPLAGVAVAFGAAVAMETVEADVKRLALRAGAFAAPVAAAVAGILALNVAWYGSATESGYGSADYLFSAGNVVPNAIKYAGWIVETNPLALPLALAGGVALAWRSGTRRMPSVPRLVLGAWSLALVALYLPYIQFDAWHYTRFLLPAYPAAMVLVAGVLVASGRAWRVPAVVAAAVAAAVLAGGVYIAKDRLAFGLRRAEAKYAAAGRAARLLLPPNAVTFAMLHSGSLRFYADRATLRWDLVRPEEFDALVGELEANRLVPFAVLDGAERAEFFERFRGSKTIAGYRFRHLRMTSPTVEFVRINP